jgi:hypothetical protein
MVDIHGTALAASKHRCSIGSIRNRRIRRVDDLIDAPRLVWMLLSVVADSTHGEDLRKPGGCGSPVSRTPYAYYFDFSVTPNIALLPIGRRSGKKTVPSEGPVQAAESIGSLARDSATAGNDGFDRDCSLKGS